MTEQQDEAYQEIIFDGIRFLESIARYYGPEKSIDIWDKMGEAMGPDIKGEVFFSMLTGVGGKRVHIQRGTATKAVDCIKAIRHGTGYGLKEAKDAWDLCNYKTVALECHATESQKAMIRELRNLGIRVL